MSNAITPVGAAYNTWYPYQPGANTFPVAPTAVGDLLVAVTHISDTHGAHATALSGGGVSAWQQLGPSMRGTYATVGLWMGVVDTGGPSTVAATIAGSSGMNMFAAQQFTGGAAWSVDKTGSKTNASSLVMSWPTLVPSSANELYVGCAGTTVYGPSQNTQTPGYVLPPTYAPFIYDVAVNGSQSPTATMLAKALTWTVGALISAA